MMTTCVHVHVHVHVTDTIGTSVEPLYNGQYWDQQTCPFSFNGGVLCGGVI